MGTYSRRKWILALEIAGVMVLIPLLGYLIYERQDILFEAGQEATLTRLTPPAPTPPPIELRYAYEAALGVARGYAEDAQIISASTSWHDTNRETLLAGASAWSFVFYAPTDRQALDIVVDSGGASLVKATRVWEVPPLITRGAWHSELKEVVLVFLAYGGEEFLAAHPHAQTDLHLGPDSEGRTVWSIVAFDNKEKALCSVTIDAATRHVIEHQKLSAKQ